MYKKHNDSLKYEINISLVYNKIHKETKERQPGWNYLNLSINSTEWKLKDIKYATRATEI